MADHETEHKRRIELTERGINYLVAFLVLVMGAIGTVILIQQGVVSAATIAQYGVWVIIGLVALFVLASGTKSRWDDIIVTYLLFLSIGGVGATWLINSGHVSEGYAILGGLFIVFIVLLAIYSKTGYKVTKGARFT